MGNSRRTRLRIAITIATVAAAGIVALPVGAGGIGGIGGRITPPATTLTIDMTGNGSGSVSATPVGSSQVDAALPLIGAGAECETDCTVSYPPGTIVKLAASPAARSAFTGWSMSRLSSITCGGPLECTVVMVGDQHVGASFVPIYTLTVDVVAVSGGGSSFGATMTTTDGKINCRILETPGGCSADYLEGSLVQLHADPDDDGYTYFGGYGGDCTDRDMDCTLVMTSDKHVGTAWGSGTCGATEDQLHRKDCGGGSTEPTA